MGILEIKVSEVTPFWVMRRSGVCRYSWGAEIGERRDTGEKDIETLRM